MFLKTLRIGNGSEIIRDIVFKQGINLIVDETETEDKRESGNNVGKTTVLRLIDFCLDGSGSNIYQDPEFKKSGNTDVEIFLKNENIVITLIIVERLTNSSAQEIVIRRNFKAYSEKIQEINGVQYGNKEFGQKLKELIFHSTSEKPTIRQIIAKNIRDEKNRLVNTVKVLHQTTTSQEYEAVFLFWLGVDIDDSHRKQSLLASRKIEARLQQRLKRDGNPSQILQSLIVVNRTIDELKAQKDKLNVSLDFDENVTALNKIKYELNQLLTVVNRMEYRRRLISESQKGLQREFSETDVEQIRAVYSEAKLLIPNLQKTFEETLAFHNSMVKQKLDFITKELPSLEMEISENRSKINVFLQQEKAVAAKLNSSNSMDKLSVIITDLNLAYEKKGMLEEQHRLWKDSDEKLAYIENELRKIDDGISSQDDLIQARISEFNYFFSELSNKLYGERFVLSSEKSEKGYSLNITSLSGNLGTGKKKGQIAAFDLAYIQFADAHEIRCLHFILHDQVENVHNNQISNLVTEIVENINCQYVLPILKDKLPPEIDVNEYGILTLSQSEKLFKIP